MPTSIELKPAGDSSQQQIKPNEENSIKANNLSDSMSVSAIAIDGNDISIERAHLVEPQHPPCSSPSLEDGTSYAPLIRQQTMRQETLHHVGMAWRAQQRLVQRCLDLYPSSRGTQSAEIYNFDRDIISASDKNEK